MKHFYLIILNRNLFKELLKLSCFNRLTISDRNLILLISIRYWYWMLIWIWIKLVTSTEGLKVVYFNRNYKIWHFLQIVLWVLQRKELQFNKYVFLHGFNHTYFFFEFIQVVYNVTYVYRSKFVHMYQHHYHIDVSWYSIFYISFNCILGHVGNVLIFCILIIWAD